MSEQTEASRLVVIGGGPGGYPAAFHAADLGMSVTLIERDPDPGGVCLYRGCIPSKALLHAASIVQAAREAEHIGITFAPPEMNMDRLREWKQGLVAKLTSGLGQLCRARGVTFVQGQARLSSAHSLVVELADGGRQSLEFEHAILATGSEPIRLPFVPESPRVMDSTGALVLEDVPGTLLVMGGGYIGLELGQVYAAFGTRVTVVELQASLLPGVDPDLVKPLARRVDEQFDAVMLNTRVTGMAEASGGISVAFEVRDGKAFDRVYDKVLVAVGRRPVTDGLGLEHTAVEVGPDGFIRVDGQRFTPERSIQAIGDVTGQPMLAHKATHEGRCAVEALSSGTTVYEPAAIPAVVFTDPEIAWCGLTEDEARREGMNVRTGTFPWTASGRAATLARTDGVTKIVAEARSGRLIGVGVAGHGAGELIGEGVLAMEMGAVAEDLAMTIHAHPSLSETVMEAAERVLGQSTHFFQRM